MNKEKLQGFMEKGYSCSQTVLAYFAADYGLTTEIALKVAQGFEAGMYQGATCGSATGAYMVLGLAYGGSSKEAKAKVTEAILEFNRGFEKAEGALACQDLLGINISSPENMKKAYEEGTIERVCPKAMTTAVEILEQMLK